MSDPNNSVIRIGDVKVGTVLITDGGFTCMGDHERKVVAAEPDGAPYVPCAEGHHGLDGQECNAGEHEVDFDHYIGFWLEGEEPPLEEPSTFASDMRRPRTALAMDNARTAWAALNASRNHYARKLAEKRALRKSMRELLDCYWGAGDGDEPPDFIKRAARLAGWKHKEPKS